MHASKRAKLQLAENGYATKTVVMGMLDRGTREVCALVIPNVKRETLQAKILEHVGFGMKVYTDQWTGYDNMDATRFVHKTVNHAEQYVAKGGSRPKQLRISGRA